MERALKMSCHGLIFHFHNSFLEVMLRPDQYQNVKMGFRCTWRNGDIGHRSFWFISALFCILKCHKPHEKWLPTGQGIWGSISHPSGMLWRPFRGRFWHFLQQKPVLSDQYFRFWLHLWNVNSGSRWKSMKFQWEPDLTCYTLLLSAMKTCFKSKFWAL